MSLTAVRTQKLFIF